MEKKTKTGFSIYSYLDYHVLLADLLTHTKRHQPDFNLRSFARISGLGSPSFLGMVIAKKRNLTANTASKITRGFGFGEPEKKYFLMLVKYNHEKDPDRRAILFDKLIKLRPAAKITGLSKKQLMYLSDFRYTCIREMILLDDFQEDAKWISRHLVFEMSPNEIRKAIALMLELGIIVRDTCGTLKQTASCIDTGCETDLAEATGYHESSLMHARRALHSIPADLRHISSVTIPIPISCMHEIKNIINECEQRILSVVNRQGQDYHDVYQLSTLFYPVTKKTDGARHE